MEVRDHGTWRFPGASEPFDLCWFNDRAKTARFHAARYSPGETEFPLAWKSERMVHADEVTDRYKEIAPTPWTASVECAEHRLTVDEAGRLS